jgi:hypothetical protein
MLGAATSPDPGDHRPLLHQAEIVEFTVEPCLTGEFCPVLSFSRVKAPTDLEYSVETGAFDQWEPIAPGRVEELAVRDALEPGSEIVTVRLTGSFAGLDQSFFRIFTSAPFAIQTFGAPVPGDLDASTDVVSGGIFHDRRAGQSTVNLQVINTSTAAINVPIRLVIESTTDATVTVRNADGTTADGKPYFDLTGQVPGPTLDHGEITAVRPVQFNNPDLVPFNIEVSVVQTTASPPSTVGSLELAQDSEGRTWIECTAGADVTVRASGTEPRTFQLSQRPAGLGSRGLVYFGATGEETGATVNTPGGATTP